MHTGHSQMKRKLKVTEMWFYRRTVIIPRMEHVSHDEVLKKIEAKWHLESERSI